MSAVKLIITISFLCMTSFQNQALANSAGGHRYDFFKETNTRMREAFIDDLAKDIENGNYASAYAKALAEGLILNVYPSSISSAFVDLVLVAATGGAGVAVKSVVKTSVKVRAKYVPASTPVGRRAPPKGSADTDTYSENVAKRGTNKPEKIGGRDYSGHALDTMQARGITPSVVEETISIGKKGRGHTPQETVYYDASNNVSVVVDVGSGRVISTHHGNTTGF